MASSKERNFRKIKKTYTWISIIWYILLYFISIAVINGALIFFVLYSIDSKIESKYEIIHYMSDIYEESVQKNSDDLRNVVIKKLPDFYVLDKNGSELDHYGKNTCSNIGGRTGTLFGKKNYRVYEDEEERLLHYTDGGLILPDWKLLHYRADQEIIKKHPESEEDDTLDVIENQEVISLPVWIETALSDGNRLIAKVHINISLIDVLRFVIVLICLNLIVLTLLVICIIKIIREIIRKKNLVELFLVDDVTKGNNWMAFLLKGEQILKKRRNAGKRYAMIHFVVVKYRNYCMCHSMEEGQRLLFKISELMEQSISRKKELSAHVSSSSFALLMEAENDDIVRERYEELLEKLKKIDMKSGMQQSGQSETFHTFHFQAGVQMIEPMKVNGKVKKRKDAKIEYYYNNAVTAKSTLETTDGDGIAFFDNKLMEEEQWIEKVEEHQQKALDNEEYVVYYQPKYSPDESKLIGAEALIRWQSPDFGFVPPGRFIPVFEKNGFITSIDHYMIHHVAGDQKKWLDAGLKCVPVSVNVSRAHFAESDLAEQIRDEIDSFGTPHELIEIELTESAFFDDKNAIIETIERLKSYGFSVSMDDFGSGYSSLNSLKDMNLDVLKLDADFFRGDADPARKEAVVSEAIKLAKRLNMRTVAEGVEEKEQVEFLKQQGCDMIQGYYFAKPMPKEEYEERMKEIYHIPESGA